MPEKFESTLEIPAATREQNTLALIEEFMSDVPSRKRILALLETDVDVNYVFDNSETLLMRAIHYHWDDVVDALLRRDIDLDIQDKYGRTALMLSIKEKEPRPAGCVTDKLILARANVHFKDHAEENVLDYAFRYTYGRGIHDKSIDHEICLLIEHGADIEDCSCGAENFLLNVLRSGLEKTAKLILDLEEYMDVKNMTLLLAASVNDKKSVEILLKHDASPFYKDANGKTALDHARDPQIMRMILSKKEEMIEKRTQYLTSKRERKINENVVLQQAISPSVPLKISNKQPRPRHK